MALKATTQKAAGQGMQMLGLPPRRLPGKRTIRLEACAFGKHPAWKDHIDDDALVVASTPELKFLETWLHGRMFEEHLGRNAFAGLPDQDVIELDHLIVRRLQGGTSLTLVWASTDYSRRSVFPMAICVDADGVGAEVALREGLPSLRAAAGRIREAGRALRKSIDAADPALGGTFDTSEARRAVRGAMEELLATLVATTSRLNGATGDQQVEDPGQLVTALRTHAESGPADLGLARVLYRLEKLRAPEPGTKSSSRGEALRHWRLPRCADSPERGVLQWLAVLGCFADPGLEYTFAAPEHRSWIDLFTGTPDMSTLEKLRLSDHAEAPENRTAYASVTDDFVQSISGMLDAWVSGGSGDGRGATLERQGDRPDAEGHLNAASSEPKSRDGLAKKWRNWFTGGG